MTRPAAGGGRWVGVPPERLAGWLSGFTERHGEAATTYADDVVTLLAADGSVAEVHVPFPPLVGDPVEHALRDRRVGVLLVRLGGYAAGVFDGTRLVSSKVGSRQVHGRSAAGGQSQQRFARRRVGQVRVALDAATENAVQHLLPYAASLDAVVTGGERTAVDTVLADRRLAPLLPLVVARLIDVPDPRLAVLLSSPALFRAVRIRVIDP
ncbi:MAG TPA: acVLRF1 family peptidyl-tRNA hydrolase [Mycobacteriales bacterium]|nr:acVLRF1 family peptidyl-tRNA hydrolase [Mycobacteriales bacterium]